MSRLGSPQTHQGAFARSELAIPPATERQTERSRTSASEGVEDLPMLAGLRHVGAAPPARQAAPRVLRAGRPRSSGAVRPLVRTRVPTIDQSVEAARRLERFFIYPVIDAVGENRAPAHRTSRARGYIDSVSENTDGLCNDFAQVRLNISQGLLDGQRSRLHRGRGGAGPAALIISRTGVGWADKPVHGDGLAELRSN